MVEASARENICNNQTRLYVFVFVEKIRGVDLKSKIEEGLTMAASDFSRCAVFLPRTILPCLLGIMLPRSQKVKTMTSPSNGDDIDLTDPEEESDDPVPSVYS